MRQLQLIAAVNLLKWREVLRFRKKKSLGGVDLKAIVQQMALLLPIFFNCWCHTKEKHKWNGYME